MKSMDVLFMFLSFLLENTPQLPNFVKTLLFNTDEIYTVYICVPVLKVCS